MMETKVVTGPELMETKVVTGPELETKAEPSAGCEEVGARLQR